MVPSVEEQSFIQCSWQLHQYGNRLNVDVVS